MKIINILILIFTFFFISSCDRYIGSIEENYEPSNNVSDIFIKNRAYDEIENISLAKTIYPKLMDDKYKSNFKNIYKIQKVNQNTKILFFGNNYYLNFNNSIYMFDFNDSKKKFKIDLDKTEEIIFLFSYKDDIYLITDKSKVFKLMDESFEKISDFDMSIHTEPIFVNGILLFFSPFGEVIEIDLDKNTLINKGFFTTNHGITKNFNLHSSNDLNFYLYNTGTLITLDKKNNILKDNYFLEDLNILSNIGFYSELLDTPFEFNDYFYFIDRSGLVSSFNPFNSEILWETDISNTIINYLFSIDGYLTLLTSKSIFIYNQNGDLIKFFNHSLENPISMFGINENLHIISENGISTYDLNSKSLLTFIKHNFNTDLNLYFYNSNIFIKDNKHLYILK